MVSVSKRRTVQGPFSGLDVEEDGFIELSESSSILTWGSSSGMGGVVKPKSIKYPRSSPGRRARTMLFSVMSRCKIPMLVRYSWPQRSISETFRAVRERNVPSNAPRNPLTKS